MRKGKWIVAYAPANLMLDPLAYGPYATKAEAYAIREKVARDLALSLDADDTEIVVVYLGQYPKGN